MKILFFTQDHFDAEKSRVPMANWFYENKDVQCDILCPEGSDLKLNYSKVFFFKKRGVSLKNFLRLKKILKQEQYDIVISRAIEQIILITLIRTKKIKVVFFLAGFGKLFSKPGLFKSIIKIIYKPVFKLLVKIKSAGVIVQNKEDLKYLNIENIHLMNGSGIDQINVNCNKSLEKINIVTATRLIKEKGLTSIFKLCDLIKTKPDIHYFILGDFTHLNNEEFEKINNFNSYPNICFEGFKYPITEYLNEAHFAFFPSQYPEGSPRFLIESIMHGLIPFTTKMPGCPAIISNNNGFYISSEEKVLEKMINLFSSPNKYKEYSKRSRDLFKSRYESSKVYNHLYTYLKRIF